MFEDYTSSYSSCIQIFDNPSNYFSLQRRYYLLQNSIEKSQLDFQNIKYLIKVENDSSFYIQKQELMNYFDGINVALKYICIDIIDDSEQK